jgi:HK97 family phage portal protein
MARLGTFLAGLFGAAAPQMRPQAAYGDGMTFNGLNDPALLEFIRAGQRGGGSVEQAMRHPAVLRAVELLSGSIGMLPLYVKRKRRDGSVEFATDTTLWRVLQHKPNGWQTPFQFKSLMQHWALVHGNAYAQIVRRAGSNEVLALNPIRPGRVTVEQRTDFSLEYRVSRENRDQVVMRAGDILHLRGPSEDGITGLSRVQLAADVIATGSQARRAARRIFENGIMTGGALRHPGKLSPEAFERLRQSMQERLEGIENAGRWMILEEGMEAAPYASTAKDSQLVEMGAAGIDDIGRMFGIPRPLLGVDETSWGSGIEQLAILFVRFGLAPWFTAWEDALNLACIAERDWGTVYTDFDERELLRGSMKDQAEFFAKASGAGGHKPWMEPNEIREISGLSPHPDGTGLTPAGAMAQETTQP